MDWKLAEAKNRLSEVVTLALAREPQRIERRGEVVVVLAEEDYARLIGQRPGFKAFLADEGERFDGLELPREASILRDVQL
jgi:antitoxin Phd